MTWTNHPRNFHTVDIAKEEHVRFITTIAQHTNVINLLYQSPLHRIGGFAVVQDLKLPNLDFYNWTSSLNLCSSLKSNNVRYLNVEDTCLDQVNMSQSFSRLSMVDPELILTNNMFQNYPLHLNFIRAGLVDSLGNVYSGSLLIVPFGCNQRLPFSPETHWKIYAENAIEQEVFVMSQYHNSDPLEFMIDGLPRIVPYLKFLWENPTIKLHVLDRETSYSGRLTLDMLAVLGINKSRVVTGHVKSEVIYLPQGGGCCSPFALNIQLLSKIFHQHIQQSNGFNNPRRNVVLLLDSADNYRLHQFDNILQQAKDATSNFDLEVQVLHDDLDYPLNVLMDLFYRAVIVVGSKAPLMSNILFCQPGTVVMEVLCASPELTMGHLQVAYGLGLRYHAIPGLSGCMSGILVDVFHVKDALEYYVSRYKEIIDE